MTSNDNNMGAMISLALEIEGLLLLLQRRGDLVHPEVASLLNKKISELAQLAGNVKIALVSVAEADHHKVVTPHASVESAPAKAEEPIATSTSLPEVKEPEIAPESKPEVSEVVEEVVPPSSPIPPVSNLLHEEHAKVVSEVTPKFTINDRFRFRKELFDGDGSAFDEALATIASMSSAKEIEEYLSDDLCLDLENQDVADFLAIVTSRFAK